MSFDNMDFLEMSEKGIVYKINKEILHPLGLALWYDTETGKSGGVYIDTEPFSYSEDIEIEKSKAYEEYAINRKKQFENA